MIKINCRPIELKHYPDGTLLLSPTMTDYAVADKDTVLLSWYFENNEEMTGILFLTKHYQSLGHEVSLYMPYIPNARMDRVKDSDDCFSLKWFADFINSLHFKHVAVLDPHSTVSEALFDNLIIYSPEYYVREAIFDIENLVYEYPNNELVIFYPDEGAMKRYSGMLKMPFAFGIKQRDWKTGKIQNYDIVGDVSGKNVLIVDDICSKGGTFCHAAELLRRNGANRLFLYVTHCEKNIFQGNLFHDTNIEKLYTTNSIFSASAQKLAKNLELDSKFHLFTLEDYDAKLYD